MKSEPSQHTFPPSLFGLLAGLTLGWGVNWPMMKLVISEMRPLHFRAFCLLGGAMGLLAISRLKGLSVRVPKGQWPRLVVVALFNITAWNVLAIYGVSLMASGRASILGYTMPAWSVLLSTWILGEPFTKRRAAGVMLGLLGMGLLMGNEIHAVGRSPLGAILMTGAALCWAFANVTMKRWPVNLPATAYVGWQMTIGVTPVLAVALTWEAGSFNPFILSLGPMFAVFYALLIGYIFCYYAWTKIVVTAPVGVSSLAVMMTPVVGVFGGILILGEKPHWQDFAALIAVLGSLATVMFPSRNPKSSRSSV